MSNLDNPFAGPMTVEEALSAQETLVEDTSNDAEEVETPAEDEAIEAEAEAPEEQELDEEPEADDGEESQVLTLSDYGDVHIEIDGEVTTLAELAKGSLRQSDYTRKTQSHAEQVRAKEAELAAREQEIAEQQQRLSALLAETDEAEPDWVAIAEEDPLGWPREKAKWDKRQAERKAAQEAAQKQAEEQMQAFRAQTATKAVEVFPEWSDASTFQSGLKARRDIALELGFTEAEYNGVQDFRLAALLEMAARYKASQAPTKAAESKLAKAPKVLKPGATPSKAAQRVKADTARQKRLSKPMTFEEALKLSG